MGKLRIKEDGMVMTDDGKAMFLGPLYASSVRSIDLEETAENDPDDEKGSLSVEADRYLFLQSGGDNGSTVAVTEKDIEARTDSFVVRSGSNEVFRVNSDGVAIASGQLESNGVILFDGRVAVCVCLFVCVCLCVFVCLCACMCVFICLFVCLCVCLFVYFVCLFLLFVCLFVCLFVS